MAHCALHFNVHTGAFPFLMPTLAFPTLYIPLGARAYGYLPLTSGISPMHTRERHVTAGGPMSAAWDPTAVCLTREALLTGAAREFPRPFVDDYLRMVRACAEHDRDEIILRSTRMGFLTGALCLPPS
jgi:hypothetical protein